MENQSGTGGSEREGSGNFANDRERASEAGKKGGQQTQTQRGGSRESTQQGPGSERSGSGNFANDPQRANEAGQKGGEHSHGGTDH
jgi:general stress protein YciG